MIGTKTWLRALAVAVVLGLALGPADAADSDLIDLQWDDLIPADQRLSEDLGVVLGIVEHGQLSVPEDDDPARYTQVVTEYDGKRVRLPGYMVPLAFTGEGAREFLLVPYFGACIHVPPPPPNQIVFVTTDEPYQLETLFQAVYVSGTFGLASTATDLAESEYTLAADDIVPYIAK